METKILDINPDILIPKVEDLGATKVFDDIRTVTYFQHTDSLETAFLKLTQEGEKLKLTSQDHMTHKEVKLFVSREEECIELLKTLSFVPVSRVQARRTSYELGSIDLDIDFFPSVPPFMEIDMGESPVMTIDKLMEKLDLKTNKQGIFSTPDIVGMYGKSYWEVYKI